jgi:penicillin amidase
VTTTRDAQGIWFIEGGTLYEVYEAMGYAVATDRLYQMDIYRRLGRGRLSELLGSAAIGNDWFLRTIGYSDEEYAEMFAGLSDDAQTVFTAYTAGINRRVAEFNPVRLWRDMPDEYWLLTIQSVLLSGGPPVLPQPWHVNDVMATVMLHLREFDPEGQQAVLGHGQLDNAVLAQTLAGVYGLEGLAMFQDLRWFNDPSAQTMVPIPAGAKAAPASGVDQKHLEKIVSMPKITEAVKQIRARADEIEKLMEESNADIKMGSYAWAISGDRTATGNPMLYSGPQMGFSVPSAIAEGSIRGGGLNISGMTIPGTPGFPIGRTPHHAWSMQVGHAHTMDYYFEPPQAVFLHRMETINVFAGEPVTVPIWRSSHGPIIEPLNYNPADPPAIIVSWAYAHWKKDAQAIETMLHLARAESIEEFDAGIEVFPVSQHTTYVDRDGNIAYWMSGYDPVRAAGVDPRLPSFGDGTMEWTGERMPRVHDANTAQGWYGGWNNKSAVWYLNAFNNPNYYLGPVHRAQVVEDYLSAHDNLTFEEVRDLALNVATTDSFITTQYGDGGGNTWPFMEPYFAAAVAANPTDDRNAALAMIQGWDGHFVAGGPSEWRWGAFRADAWALQDEWIHEVMHLTFDDEFTMAGIDNTTHHKGIEINVLLRALDGAEASIPNLYDWFQDKSGSGKPTTAEEIIILALDNVIAEMGLGPYNVERGYITYTHYVAPGQPLYGVIWQTPWAARSTYAQCVEYDMNGPLRIESMFPLGQSGASYYNGTLTPTFDPNFFSMTPVFDNFAPRPFPLFD